MRLSKRWVSAAALVGLTIVNPAASFALGADAIQSEPALNRSVAAADGASTISYFQEVPCATGTAPRPVVARHKPRHIHHVRPRAHRVRPVIKPLAHHLRQKTRPLRRHKVVAHKTRAVPARCEILHRDRLFGGPETGADAAPLVPTDFAVNPPGTGDGASAPALAGFYPTASGGGSGGPVGVGGGGVGGAGEPTGGGVISPAPEPQTWLLMFAGVMIAGLGLRLQPRRAIRSKAV